MSVPRIASHAPSHSPSVWNSSVLRVSLRYLLPFAAVSIACIATHILDVSASENPNLFLFFGAIVMTAWFGGAGPGWLAVVLSILAADYFFSPPIYVLDLSAKDMPWFAAFALCAVVTNALSLQRRRMESKLRRARDKLEQRVLERTRDLQQSNEKLVAATKERVLAEAALRETQNELARVARIMTATELTASIAHEVNQPLAAVVANSEAALNWLRRSPPALSSASESIAAAVVAGQRASDVIARIRSLLTNGAPTLTTIDINELVSSVVALVQINLTKREIAVVCQLEPEPPPIVGDRIQLQQLVLNLLNNAADAVASVTDRERELVVRTGFVPGDKIAIIVEDNGSGLSNVDVDKLFRPFYSAKQDGMGMGLSICRTIATSHNGTIHAMARKPHGAAFEVVLPLRTLP